MMAQRIRTAAVPRASVHPHPRNPRPVNDERVEAMASSYEADPSILERHPILVRENGSGLTVLSGHHRLMMANRLNLPEVWVDVWEMDEDEAYFELVRANEQEPMDLLSYGLHFLRMPERMLPGQYAKAIGRSATFVAAARRAAEVYESLPSALQDRVGTEFGGWYLAHIGRTDPSVWQEVTEQVFANGLTVAQTEALVNEYVNRSKRPNAPAAAPQENDDNPFLDVANGDGEFASPEEREQFIREAREAAEARDRGDDDEPMFKGGDGESARAPRALKSGPGADPRETFGMVLHLFRQAHDFVAGLNTRDLDQEQKAVARQILQGLLDALDA
jgi:ParB-like chromosome segregation protein Spo0J